MAKSKRLVGYPAGPLSGVPRGTRNGFREGKTPRSDAPRGRKEVVKKTAYELGKEAKAAGTDSTACPFDVNSSMGENWLAGWEDTRDGEA